MYSVMPDDPPYILEIEGIDDENAGPPGASSDPGTRNWIGVQFECCGVYSRIYRNRQGTAYAGYCPRCSRTVRVRIGPDGTSHRMFRAY